MIIIISVDVVVGQNKINANLIVKSKYDTRGRFVVLVPGFGGVKVTGVDTPFRCVPI